MPRSRSRGLEVPQRPSLRGPPQLRTSSSDSDPTLHRPVGDRKIGDRRSPRGSQSDPVSQKRLGTRIAGLESQLGQAQDELRNLKEQLSSAEAAKTEAHEKLDKKTKKPAVSVENDLLKETDVFEVPVEKMAIETVSEDTRKDDKGNESCTEHPSSVEQEKSALQELAMKEDEIKTVREKLEEKEKEAELLGQENESLKAQLKEAAVKVTAAHSKEEEATLKLRQLGEELETSKTNEAQLSERLKLVEEAKETLEAEMKKIRVQTEQWRKAADAAAAVLSGGVDMTGRIPERCGSMDKHFIGGFGPQPGGAFAGFDDVDDGFEGGKRKGSGIKMLGDLWRKKGQK